MKKHDIESVAVSHGIPARLREAWLSLQGQNPALRSPYFSPSFTEIVASTRDNVELAVVKENGQIVALLPYERRRWNFSGPVGAFLSDYHGAICRPNFTCAPLDLLRACRLSAWDFEHVPQAQTFFMPCHRRQQRSPIIDLTDGYEAYTKERREAGTEQIKKNANLMRRLEREVGPLRFVSHSSDRALFDQLLAWKTTQFQHNRWRDIFSIPWVRQTMEKIHATQTAEFSGILSLLYAGDKLVAAHFGMRSATIWHYWFPSYDPAFARYSPGVMLLLKMAEAADLLGIKTIDLGCGEHPYKERLMNNFVPTARVSLELTCPATLARRAWLPVSKLTFKARYLIGKTGAAVNWVAFRGRKGL
jgi:CelD/BcsL family acetyltransferase involved in cellulose biosynthesis